MELIDYLDPVELEKPDEYYLQSEEVISKQISIHTANLDFDDLSGYDIAILGVPEDRNSHNKGAALSPNAIRAELYKLITPASKTKIIDLGNIKSGNTYNDTYFAVKDVIYQLLCENVSVVLLGGSQDITIPGFQALENLQDKINLTVIDSLIDSQKEALKSTADSYLFEILLKKSKLFRFAHLGHQAYLTDKGNLELINTLFHDAIRLGEVRSDLRLIEPILRDSDFVSLDISAIRQADAPGHFRATPNGFYSEEACQLSRYAGTGDNVRIFGVFEVNSRLDTNHHTAALAAQLIWHFLDGIECRTVETPDSNNSNFKTFIVGHTDLDQDMTFYKSMTTERWWLEIPNISGGESTLIACSDKDYQMACNHEVPNIWWKNFQKLT